MARYLSYRDGNKTDEVGFYRFISKLMTSGVLDGGTVSESSPAAMSVDVTAGDFLILDNEYQYHGWSDAAETLVIGTADVSNPRIDVVVAYVDKSLSDNTNANSPDGLVLEVVAGAPAASPTAPSAGTIQTQIGASNPYIILAEVSVPTSASSIVDANITNTTGIGYVENQRIAPDSITGARMVNGMVKSRQGGSSGDASWDTPGSTNTDTSDKDAFIQCGSKAVTANPTTVTFPVAFNQIPVVIATVSSANSANVFVVCTAQTPTTASFRCLTDAGAVSTTEQINWVAIGQ